MRKILLTTLAAVVAFCVFTMVMGNALDAVLPNVNNASYTTATRPNDRYRGSVPTSHEVNHAFHYAAWCGGYVEITPVLGGYYDVVVVGCDQ